MVVCAASVSLFIALQLLWLPRKACPPRIDYASAHAWVRANYRCERRDISATSSWILWVDYCPVGELGFFIIKAKTGQQKEYLFERMPKSVWHAFISAASTDAFYNSEIRGTKYRFFLVHELSPKLTGIALFGHEVTKGPAYLLQDRL